MGRGIKKMPKGYRYYFKTLKEEYSNKKKELDENINNLISTRDELYKSIVEDYNLYKDSYTIDLYSFDEFVENKYKSGKFFRTAKGVLVNRDGNYELIGRNADLYRLATIQKNLYELQPEYDKCEQMLNMSLETYTKLLKTFYIQVHKKMILEGAGYVFESNLGWICINRCKKRSTYPLIDYKATKEKKEKLLAEGKRIYNKHEAAWCLERGIEYDAVDPRVYMNNEYYYEIPLIDCTLSGAKNIHFYVTENRGPNNEKRKTNDQFLKESNRNTDTICGYEIGLRIKLNLCLEIDKLLYAKFIRNDNQTKVKFKPSYRKSRQ